MGTEENKTLVRKWFEDIDHGDVAVVDQYVARDYQDNNPPPFPGVTPDFAGAQVAFKYALSASSNFHHEIGDQMAEGDLVVTRLTGSGTHTGEFMGIPPTGKDVQMQGITIHRIKDGKLVEHWGQVDGIGLLVQLGALPPPA